MSSDANDLGLDLSIIATGAVPPLPGGPQLLAFTDALTTDHLGDLGGVRSDLVAAIDTTRSAALLGFAPEDITR